MNNYIRFFVVMVLSLSCIGASRANNLSKKHEDLLAAIKSDSSVDIMKTVESTITQDQGGKSPMSVLLKAIINDSTDEIKQTIQPLLTQGKNGTNPLLWAVLLKKSNAVKALLDCGVKPDENALKFAGKLCDIKTMLLFVERRMDISNYVNSYLTVALCYLAEQPNDAKKIILKLLNSGIAIDDEICNMTFKIHSILWFIKNIKNPSKKLMESCVKTAFRYINDHEHKNINVALALIQEVINHGYNVNDLWNIHGPALLKPKSKTLDTFIRRGWLNSDNINHIYGDGKRTFTPLSYAILGNNITAVKNLLGIAADVNKQSNLYGDNYRDKELAGHRTPLYFATMLNRSEIVALLLEHGATLE